MQDIRRFSVETKRRQQHGITWILNKQVSSLFILWMRSSHLPELRAHFPLQKCCAIHRAWLDPWYHALPAVRAVARLVYCPVLQGPTTCPGLRELGHQRNCREDVRILPMPYKNLHIKVVILEEKVRRNAEQTKMMTYLTSASSLAFVFFAPSQILNFSQRT